MLADAPLSPGNTHPESAGGHCCGPV